MYTVLFNILRNHKFRNRTMYSELFISEFYSFIDTPEYISPKIDSINLSNDCLRVNVDLKKSIDECKKEHKISFAL